MTNKQAIDVITSCDGIIWNRLTDAENEALSMAIKALSVQPEQECEKCIFKPFKQFYKEHILCENCKYWDIEWIPSYSDGTSHYCPMIDLVTNEHFYCKYGEFIDEVIH